MFGSIIACLLLIMIPHISAVEYHTVQSDLTEKINEHNSGTLQKLIEIMPTMTTQGSFIDKIITTVLFFVFAVSVGLTYVLLPATLIVFFKILENFQLTTDLFVFLSAYLSLGISILPQFLIGNLIKNIGAWDQETLDKILGNISLVVSLAILMLNFLGFLDWFEESATHQLNQ